MFEYIVYFIHKINKVVIYILTCLFFCKFSMLCEMIPEVTSAHNIDNKVQILSILECKVHVYKETISQSQAVRYQIKRSVM